MIRPEPHIIDPSRLPWRQNMTLCVAAECHRHKRFFNAIVFSTDTRVEGQIATADIGRKIAVMPNGFYPVLMAGTQTRALELVGEITHAIARWDVPLDQDYQSPPWEMLLRESVTRQKAKLANEITSGSFGITYEEFLKCGKSSFPDDVFRNTMAEIARTSLDCYLLVLAFSQSDPRIFRITETGIVETCEHFAAIGSGYYIAEAALFQRSQSVQNDLGTTLYNVFEAMTLGANAPGVGTSFQIGVAQWQWYEQPNPHNHGDVELSFLEPEYYRFLSKQFTRYGPKPVKQIAIRPRWIKPEQRAIVLTPKGELSPENKLAKRRRDAALQREAKKRAAKQLASGRSAGQQ